MKWLWLIPALLLLSACQHGQTKVVTTVQLPRKEVPPLPWNPVRGKAGVSGVAQLPAPFTVTLRWTNPETPWSTNYSTRVEGSSDLIHWTEVASVSYAAEETLVLTDRPTTEFYRLINYIDP